MKWKVQFNVEVLLMSSGHYWINEYTNQNKNITPFFPPIIYSSIVNTAQKIKICIKDFFSKCDQIRRELRIWSHLLKKSSMENFIFCAVKGTVIYFKIWLLTKKFIWYLLLSHVRCLKQEYNKRVITGNTTNYFVTNITLRYTTEGLHLTFTPHVFFPSS